MMGGCPGSNDNQMYTSFSGRPPIIYARPAMMQWCLKRSDTLDLRGALYWSQGAPAARTRGQSPGVPSHWRSEDRA